MIKIIPVIFVAGASLFFYFYYPENKTEKKAPRPQYTCSMHPQVLRDGPGRCPICGMELTPLVHREHENNEEEKSSGDDRIIRVEPGTIMKTGIVTDIVKRKKISREIRTVAHIDYNETSEAIVNARVSGWVEKLYAEFTGQTVRKGQPLAEIYSPELVSTQEEYLQLYRKSLSADEYSKKELERLLLSARKRLLYWNITEKQIERIEKSNKVNRYLTIYSPHSGVVVEKKIVLGTRITEGMDMFRITDLSTVWVMVHISEHDIPFVREGMQAAMTVPQIPGRTFNGKVSFIFPYMEEKTRDLKVRISFPDSSFKLKPGMYANILLKQELPGTHIVVPSSSVIRTGTRNIVFTYLGDGRFLPRIVQTGVMDGAAGIQILDGLNENDAIVLSGQFLLDSESSLQESLRKMEQSR